jgi:hypothetical protein
MNSGGSRARRPHERAMALDEIERDERAEVSPHTTASVASAPSTAAASYACSSTVVPR